MRKKNTMKKWLALVTSAIMVLGVGGLAACGDKDKTYTASFTSAEVADGNGLYREMTAAKAEEWGLVQEDTLVLKADGTYEFTKTLKSTGRSNQIPEDQWKPIVVTYVFYGEYVQRDNLVNLKAATSAIGDADWGSMDGAVPGFFVSGKYTSGEATSERESDETILNMFPGAYLSTDTENIAFQVTVTDDGKVIFD